MDQNKIQSLSSQYIDVTNTMLNGWYSISVEKCEGFKCSAKNIPIRVKMKETKINPDYIITFSSATRVSGKEPRSSVKPRNVEPDTLISKLTSKFVPNILNLGIPTATFYAENITPSTMAHEAVHMVLQYGDEYVEEDPTKWRYKHLETVNTIDWSLAANHRAFGRWSLLHRRHFNFVKVFMEEVLSLSGYSNCNVTLKELARPTQLYLKAPSIGIGYARYGGEHGFYIASGLDLGIPLNRLREWNFLLGIHGKWIAQLSGDLRSALLLGLRTGFEYRHTPSSGGLKLGGFAEVGYIRTSETLSEKGGVAPYGEFVGSLGYARSPPFGTIKSIQLELEAAYGTSLNLVDPEKQKWYRIGVNLGWRF